MAAHICFSDFALGLPELSFPMAIEKWLRYFEHHFSEAKAKPFSAIDIQHSKCDIFKIKYNIQVRGNEPGKFSALPFTATLCLSPEVFYLLMYTGEGHSNSSTAINFIKANENFTPLGGGRFKCKPNNSIISFEEDELNKYYMLIVSRPDLLTRDPLFNYARQFILDTLEENS